MPTPTDPTLYVAISLAVLSAGIMFLLHCRLKASQKRRIGSILNQLALSRQLLTDLQQHRGLSNGLLSGDTQLKSQVEGLAHRVDVSMSTATRVQTPFNARWQELHEQWRVTKQVVGKTATQNLTDHNRLIRDVIYLIEDTATQIDLSQGNRNLAHLSTIWQEVIQAAEWSGQARALGTGIAASGSSTSQQRVRMRFLHQKVQELTARAFSHLENNTGDSAALAQTRPAINHFLECIEKELIAPQGPSIDTRAYFDRASKAVDGLLALMDAAIVDLRKHHCL
ncbi:nitrate- and nitrite sensing domain-containing protein [Marinobacterium litorale]|uniref:nitrate- and nitrite sensing domain-containing protein n=1 Tax=Marinobacterium litorale TaxID=404770 RepID=UPI000401F2C4|nr:nitrate- and nitrite sensing domain-containing protein [Marinobacterium litorale]